VNLVKEGVEVFLFFQRSPERKDRTLIKNFTKDFLKECGWKAEELTFDRRYLRMKLSREASSEETNRPASA
jgi:hypothetical protein